MKISKEMPTLTNVSIAGYKSFGEPTEVKLGKVNLLIGANGAGKSNFIALFNLLNNALTGNLQNHIMRMGGAEQLCYNGVRKNNINFKLEIESSKAKDVYDLELAFQAPNGLFISKEYIKYSKQGEQESQEHYISNDGYELGIVKASTSIIDGQIQENANAQVCKVVYGLLSGVRTFQFHDTTDTSRVRGVTYILDNKYLKSDAGNLASYLYRLREEARFKPYYEKIVRYIRRVMPEFQDFVLSGHPMNPDKIMLNWTKAGTDYILMPSQFSDGTLRFIALATLLLQPPALMPTVIVIDEPELGLHPMAVNILADMIQCASESTQIIVATQSPMLLDNFQPQDILVAENSDSGTQLKHLDEKALQEWLSEYTMSELWDKNVLGGQP